MKMKNNAFKYAIIFTTVMLFSGLVKAQTTYFVSNSGNDSNNGLSWATAKATIYSWRWAPIRPAPSRAAHTCMAASRVRSHTCTNDSRSPTASLPTVPVLLSTHSIIVIMPSLSTAICTTTTPIIAGLSILTVFM